ncbi:unnamed protein product [Closterium sp. Naga37s-1]|nr:unnamed protein product [Closterium sp. Naga37s-1]
MSATGTPPRRIVVAIDDSTGSTEALQWALDNMQLQPGRDTIVLVNTQSYSAAPTSRPGFHVSQGEIQADTQRKKDVGYKLLEKYKAQCEARQLLCETRVMIGDARLSISEAAEQAKADAVVVGSRGHGALKRTGQDRCAKGVRALQAAEQAKADAVVVGSHGHGSLKRRVMGSVSECCPHHCPMPYAAQLANPPLPSCTSHLKPPLFPCANSLPPSIEPAGWCWAV